MTKPNPRALRWTIASLEGLPESIDGRPRFEMMWGGQYEWNCLLPVAWRNYSSSEIQISRTNSGSDYSLSWYTTPLHLLGLGLGWTDIGLGLFEMYRTGARPSDHPVLEFVVRNWGLDLQDLLVWLATSPIASEIADPLGDLRKKSAGSDEPWLSTSWFTWDRKDLEKLLENWGGGERREKERSSFSGGTDPMHLTSHFAKSVIGEDFVLPGEVNALGGQSLPADYYSVSTKRGAVWLPQYAGFSNELHYRSIGKTGLPVFDPTAVIAVNISGFGHLGNFTRSRRTGRWYVIPDGLRTSEAAEIHMLGNRVGLFPGKG